MRRLSVLLALCLLLAGCAQQPVPASGITFTDDTGSAVTLPEKPGTVAVLTSSLADLWLTAGGTVSITVGETVERGFVGSDVILVDDGAGKTIDLERLIAAEPDFVLYAADLAGQAECAGALRAAGIPAAGFSVDSFEDYLSLLKTATDILGTPEAYEAYGTAVEKRVNDLIEQANAQNYQPEILFVRAGSTAKVTKAKTAENHFACAMLKALGTFNIAETAPILLDGLSTEAVLLSDPDFIFYTTMGDEAAGAAYMESLISDPVWSTLTAVKEGRVYLLPKDLFQYKPNSRWDEAYRYLTDILYGETT